jgi:hypothetical protein
MRRGAYGQNLWILGCYILQTLDVPARRCVLRQFSKSVRLTVVCETSDQD